jgi:TonB family protein
MKRVLFLFCASILLAGAVKAQESKRVDVSDPLTWKTYTVKGDEFSVSLPSIPEMKTSKAFQPQIQKERAGRHLRTVLDGIKYGVDVLENPAGQSLGDFIAEYDATRDFKNSAERNITVDGVAGKEYTSQIEPPARVQLFVTERRFYRFITIGGGTDSKPVEHFFSSIKLGKDVDGVNVDVGPGIPLELESGERVYTGSEVDKRVRLLERPAPIYPEEARRKGGRPLVILQAVFSATGKVVDIRVIRPGQYGLTEACIDAAKNIKFVPAVKDGKNVSMYMRLEYNFVTF